jgi:Arc/MetJ family transcription regulator
MNKRVTVEIDEQLLDRAQRALGTRTIRATVEEALRRVAESAESEIEARTERQESSEVTRVRNRVKLPLVWVAHAARPEEEITPERASQVLLDEEVAAHRDLMR